MKSALKKSVVSTSISLILASGMAAFAAHAADDVKLKATKTNVAFSDFTPTEYSTKGKPNIIVLTMDDLGPTTTRRLACSSNSSRGSSRACFSLPPKRCAAWRRRTSISLSISAAGTSMSLAFTRPSIAFSYCPPDAVEATDTALKFDLLTAYVDELSAPYLEDAEIDFVTDQSGRKSYKALSVLSRALSA